MKILVAEDEPVSRLMVERFLTQWGYQVVVACDGEEAWWILQQEDSPKLAILDWMMPRMDGPEICRQVRKRIGSTYVYILLVTAKMQKSDLIAGLESGADDYVTKPFDPDELRVRLRAGRRILDLQDHLLTSSEAARFPTTLDFLTGFWNREAILGILRQLIRDQQDKAPIGVILGSLDHFKHVLTTYGSLAADAVVRETARRIRAAVRIYDSAGRYAGGEFLVVAPGCNPEELLQEAQKLRSSVAFESVDIIGGAISVTMSFGVAIRERSNPIEAQALLRAAESALRRARVGGRNRIESASEEDFSGKDLASLTNVAGG